MEQNNVNEMKQNIKPNKIVITNQKEINLTGITKVNSATETTISLIINNKNLVIEGEKLHVLKLDVDSGIIDIEGCINTLKFDKSKQNKNIFKRIFS